MEKFLTMRTLNNPNMLQISSTFSRNVTHCVGRAGEAAANVAVTVAVVRKRCDVGQLSLREVKPFNNTSAVRFFRTEFQVNNLGSYLQLVA
ncbi:hypothetical protein GWI33_008748 [Rhynchophorus ferrugineus]|uniref:Uncharacterized protein n=1 Tax=Rhynchophorus ferrugineus TaxID=354439 RepID=A0A834MFQ0_RHYFE|nr:hypothetical protein GWI33_008748 [Rhynchophorus ferrugineus]